MQHNLHQLLQTENGHLQKLNDLVVNATKEEELLSSRLNEFEDKHPAFTGKLADKVAAFGGSWKFIIAFTLFVLVWMGTNIYLISKPFDPYPFILLNLVLSSLAAIQAPVIMMSQNRKEEKDRQRAINDYLVNLKAEIEIRNMHQKLDLLIAEQMRTLFDIQKLQVEQIEEIKTMLNKKPA